MLPRFIKSLGLALTLAAAPFAAQAVTVTPTSDSYTVLAILDETGGFVAPGTTPLLLGPNGVFAITGVAAHNTNPSGLPDTGFEATQDFVNNTGQAMVFGGTTQNPLSGFVNPYIEVITGGVTTTLDLTSSTFTVAAGTPFTIVWGAEDVTTSTAFFNLRIAAVPLPAGALLLLTGLGGLAIARRRKTA